MQRLTLIPLVGLAFLPFAVPAQGGLLLFDNRAEFNAATTGRTLVDFEDIAPDGGWQFVPSPPGITLSGVNFSIDRTTSDGHLFVIGDGFYYAGNSVLSSQGSSGGIATDFNVRATFPGPYTAVGMDFGVVDPGINYTFTFTLSTGATFLAFNQGGPVMDFIGVTSTEPIAWIRVAMPSVGHAENVDNFTFANATSPVPEPSSLCVWCIALVLGIARWRRRHS